MLKAYVGTKIIMGEPMDECTFLSKYKHQDLPNRETQPGYHVVYPDNYHSWSPKDVFENVYRELLRGETIFVLECAPEHLVTKKGVENGKEK